MIEEVTALFKDREDELLPITGKTSNHNLERLCEVLINLLQAVELPGGNDDAGLIISRSDYKAAHSGVPFDRLSTLLKAYEPTIASNTMRTNMVRAEHEWT